MNPPIHAVLKRVNEWILRSDIHNVRNFILEIIKRVKSVDLLRQTVIVLSSLLSKDYIYARSQCNCSDRDLHDILPSNSWLMQHESDEVSSIHHWFTKLGPPGQKSFVYAVIRMIDDPSILHHVCQLCKLICAHVAQGAHVEQGAHEAHVVHDVQENTKLTKLKQEPWDTDSNNSYCDVTDHQPINVESKPHDVTVDFIAKLPVYLAKRILKCLSPKDLCIGALVSSVWHRHARQVRVERHIQNEMKEESILMQGVSAKGIQTCYANIRCKMLPNISTNHHQDEMYGAEIEVKSRKSDFDFTNCGLQLTPTMMEERNLFCGSYNVLVIDQCADRHRVVNYGGSETLVSGSNDRVVRILDVRSGQTLPPIIQGHPGVITALHMSDSSIYSGSYDTTIRCWEAGSCGCKKILSGHRKTIVSIDSCGNTLVSGSKDGQIKAWDLVSGRCRCTFKHSDQSIVTCVKLSGDLVVSACDRGVVKVWDLVGRRRVKRFRHTQSGVNDMCCDDYHIITAGDDGFALTWLKLGKVKKCFKGYRHPKRVLCVETAYERVISGCEDGKVRVLHLYTGECMRALRGNSNCDPIISLHCATDNREVGDRIIVNTRSNVLLLQFEPIDWDYHMREDEVSDEVVDAGGVMRSTLHSYTRACRSRMALASPTHSHRSKSASRPTTAHSTTSQISYESRRTPVNFLDLQPEFAHHRVRPYSQMMERSRSAVGVRPRSTTSTRHTQELPRSQTADDTFRRPGTRPLSVDFMQLRIERLRRSSRRISCSSVC